MKEISNCAHISSVTLLISTSTKLPKIGVLIVCTFVAFSNVFKSPCEAQTSGPIIYMCEHETPQQHGHIDVSQQATSVCFVGSKSCKHLTAVGEYIHATCNKSKQKVNRCNASTITATSVTVTSLH
eukprot:m.356050 g.356050  ORF g.356050 m.356050 type:complete len:126 (+) comp17426_c0_seq1:2527-2904(+)